MMGLFAMGASLRGNESDNTENFQEDSQNTKKRDADGNGEHPDSEAALSFITLIQLITQPVDRGHYLLEPLVDLFKALVDLLEALVDGSFEIPQVGIGLFEAAIHRVFKPLLALSELTDLVLEKVEPALEILGRRDHIGNKQIDAVKVFEHFVRLNGFFPLFQVFFFAHVTPFTPGIFRCSRLS
jgi:hypothetical protein